MREKISFLERRMFWERVKLRLKEVERTFAVGRVERGRRVRDSVSHLAINARIGELFKPLPWTNFVAPAP